jgi:hypothetical protein
LNALFSGKNQNLSQLPGQTDSLTGLLGRTPGATGDVPPDLNISALEVPQNDAGFSTEIGP